MKRKSLSLQLKKIKIVNFATMSTLRGAGAASNNDDTLCHTCKETVTKDKANTNNGVPTVGNTKTEVATKQPPATPTISCDPCI